MTPGLGKRREMKGILQWGADPHVGGESTSLSMGTRGAGGAVFVVEKKRYLEKRGGVGGDWQSYFWTQNKQDRAGIERGG